MAQAGRKLKCEDAARKSCAHGERNTFAISSKSLLINTLWLMIQAKCRCHQALLKCCATGRHLVRSGVALTGLIVVGGQGLVMPERFRHPVVTIWQSARILLKCHIGSITALVKNAVFNRKSIMGNTLRSYLGIGTAIARICRRRDGSGVGHGQSGPIPPARLVPFGMAREHAGKEVGYAACVAS